MARYSTQDQRNLEQLIEEGWLDRLKAKGAEASGAFKGLKDRTVGGLEKAAGSIASKYDSDLGSKISQSGSERIQSSKQKGYDAKIDYLKKNIDKRFQSFVADLQNDLTKLGVDIGKIEMDSSINDALDSLKNSVDNVVDSQSQDSETPPPLPSQQPPPLPQQEDGVEDENPTEYSFKDIVNKRRQRGKDMAKRQKAKTQADPRKGKVRKDPLAKYAAPEQEEDLDDLFWK